MSHFCDKRLDKGKEGGVVLFWFIVPGDTAHSVRDRMVAGSGGDWPAWVHIRKQEEMNAGTQPAFLSLFGVSVRVFPRQRLI